jgi:hypothetical protein
MFGETKRMCRVGLSASLCAHIGAQLADLRPRCANIDLVLPSMRVFCHALPQRRERVRWSISVLQVVDQAKSAQTAFSRLLSLSWAWLGMRLSKTQSDLRSVTVQQCPNRCSYKPQTNTTHVTLSQKGGRNYAPAFFVTLAQRCASYARTVYANYTSNFEVSAC